MVGLSKKSKIRDGSKFTDKELLSWKDLCFHGLGTGLQFMCGTDLLFHFKIICRGL